jgi:hypothetical protein
MHDEAYVPGAALAPLSESESDLVGPLRTHVERLAGRIGERNVFRPARLHAAAGYLEGILAQSGQQVCSQRYQAGEVDVRNLELEQPGARRPEEIVVVGAHYDSVMGSPGANDNATGVAAALELARRLAPRERGRTLRFVLFVNEEPPFFRRQQMGSLRYAQRARQRGERIVAMLSLETIGYFCEREGTQHYPFPFGLLYPSRGNFLGFVGNLSSARLLRRALRAFRRNASLPSEGVAAPGWMPGLGLSDHWSFWEQGYPALMITDTAPFRYPHYHTARDTPDRVLYEPLARAVAGLEHVVRDLAGADAS